MASTLSTLQSQAVTRLQAQTFFKSTPVITVLAENRKDIVTEVQKLIGKIGIVCIIGTPRARQDTPQKYSPPHFSRIELVTQIVENVIVNRAASGSGQPGSLVAEAVAYYLTGWAPAILGNALLIESIEPIEDERYVIYEVTNFTGGAIAAPTREE